MSLHNRTMGEEQPHWSLGPFKVRLPFVHYDLETIEFIQGIIMVVISVSLIPHLQENLGIPYEVALAFVFIAYGFGNLLPALLGTPLISGWITAALPIVATYLGDFEPGAESIKALVALNILVALIFFILGITKLGSKITHGIPNSLKAGIILGAGITALLDQIQPGGTVTVAPVAMIIAGLLAVYFMFSLSFKQLIKKYKIANTLANYGIVPAILAGILVALFTVEFPRPNIEWGITTPDFVQMWSYLPFSIGFPSVKIFMLAIPTAIISYIIAYGDIIVGNALTERANDKRKDEELDYNIDRLHIITGIRNMIMGLFAPSSGQGGPIWTAIQATIAERYTYGKKAMNSFYGGAGSFQIACGLALFVLPLITFFQPYQPLALSVTIIVTGYICIQVGIEQLTTTLETGIAGVIAIVLATHGAAYALAIGLILHFLIERTFKVSIKKDQTNEIYNDNNN